MENMSQKEPKKKNLISSLTWDLSQNLTPASPYKCEITDGSSLIKEKKER